MRIAIKIGYDGTKFNGFAIQPNRKTVEGEILNRLIKTKIIDDRRKARFQYAARTDKGVSALGNVIAFNCKGDAIKAMKKLRDIWIFGYAFVRNDFNPRNCKSKIYRYYLYDIGYDFKKMQQSAKLFEGKHNFSNFARIDSRNPIRKIDSIKIKKEGRIIKIDFEGKSFLWNQIRRMMAAIIKAARNEVEINEIEKALNGERKNFGLAPAENLVLYDIKYDFNFEKILPEEIFVKSSIFKDALILSKDAIIYHE